MKQVKLALPLILIVLTGLFSSCNNNKPATDAVSATADSTTTPPAPPAPPVVQDNANWASEDGLYAVFTSNAKGKIVCKLEYTQVPLTVSSFVTLAEGKNTKATVNKGKPFFNGLTWHRVEPGFVIQGGDPKGNGSGGCGYEFPDEINPALSHKMGALAMANSGPNTNGSQIYITKAPTPSLDGHYNVFGNVVSGMSVVNAITVGDKMDTVTIVRVGKDAQAWDAVATFNAKMADAQKAMDEAKKKRDDQMQEAIKQHNAQVSKMAASYAGWDAKAKAKYPGAKRTASGLYYIVSTPGTGATAKPGQTVVAHYTGTLWDGKKFDSSKDRGQPFEFAIGQHQVIDGWDEGFALFKVGSKGKLIIPYYLAYGEQGAGNGAIPSKADLIFDVEMLGVK